MNVRLRKPLRVMVRARARFVTQLSTRLCVLCEEPLGFGVRYLEDEQPRNPMANAVCHLDCACWAYEYRTPNPVAKPEPVSVTSYGLKRF